MADGWTVKMAGEGEQAVWAEGEQVATIEEVSLVSKEESKSGNPYFLWTISNSEGERLSFVTTLIKKKRWMLKNVLKACGITAKEDDPDEKYKFSPNDVIGKEIFVLIKNEENSFTTDSGEPVTNTRSQVKRVSSVMRDSDPPKKKNKPTPEKEEDEEVPF